MTDPHAHHRKSSELPPGTAPHEAMQHGAAHGNHGPHHAAGHTIIPDSAPGAGASTTPEEPGYPTHPELACHTLEIADSILTRAGRKH